MKRGDSFITGRLFSRVLTCVCLTAALLSAACVDCCTLDSCIISGDPSCVYVVTYTNPDGDCAGFMSVRPEVNGTYCLDHCDKVCGEPSCVGCPLTEPCPPGAQ